MTKDLIIKTLKVFEKKSSKLMTKRALEDLYGHLYLNPDSGVVIKGTGGVRKLRWQTGKSNKGKSGGVRIIYYYEDEALIIMLSLYSKSEKENLTQAERNTLKKLLPDIIAQVKEEL